MRTAVPSKINLHLRVGPPRPDGFHPLLTWMTTIGLFDTLHFNICSGREIAFTCTELSLPCDDRNIVVKAAKLLRGASDLAASIHLEKQIPHGGGLGGGSSDAAAALFGLNRLWNLGRTIEELHELAATLGSDVPFFLHGPSSVCRGRGEVVLPIASPEIARWVLLILPDLSMSTPSVYRMFDSMNLGNSGDIDNEPDWNRWAALPSLDLLPMLINDLEPPAFAIQPPLGTLRAELQKQLARPVRMSGSGSSLFTLYDDRSEAIEAAEALARQGVKATVVQHAPTRSKPA